MRWFPVPSIDEAEGAVAPAMNGVAAAGRARRPVGVAAEEENCIWSMPKRTDVVRTLFFAGAESVTDDDAAGDRLQLSCPQWYARRFDEAT